MPSLFAGERTQNRKRRAWRYHDRRIVGGYDPLNEPVRFPGGKRLEESVPRLKQFYKMRIVRPSRKIQEEGGRKDQKR